MKATVIRIGDTLCENVDPVIWWKLRLAENVFTGEWQGPDANTSHPECPGNWQSCVARG